MGEHVEEITRFGVDDFLHFNHLVAAEAFFGWADMGVPSGMLMPDDESDSNDQRVIAFGMSLKTRQEEREREYYEL